MQIHIATFIYHILTSFKNAGFDIFIVGGAVRDLMLQRPVKDWDFTTNATPEDILTLFPDAFYDNTFGTVGLINPEDHAAKEEGKLERVPVYEVTTYRREVGYSDKRHPDKIEWGKSLEDDLQRRDFTINAMALKLNSVPKFTTQNSELKTIAGDFEILDPYGGVRDLQAGMVKAVGNPVERFEEDALRMMRAIRIATQLGFMIDATTLDAVRQHSASITHIAVERIRDELFKIVVTDYAADGVKLLFSSGLLEYIIPELITARGVEQGGHHTDDVWEHSLKSLQHCPSTDPVVRLATLLHDVGKPYTRAFVCKQCQTRFKMPETEELKCPKCVTVNDYTASVTFYNHEVAGGKLAYRIGKRLRLSNKQLDRLVTLVRWHMFSVDERQTDKAIRRFIRNVGKENSEDMLALRTGDRLGGGARETSWRLERFKELLIEVQKQPFSVHDLKIDGTDVMSELNIPPGKQVGEVLTRLYTEVEENQLENTPEALIAKLHELYPH